MSTLGTMKARIADELDRDDLTSQISAAIQSAIDFYEDEKFWFNEGIATTDTIAGQEYYAIPNDWISEETLTLQVSGNHYPLIKRTNDYINHIHIGSTYQGVPRDYAMYQEQLRLYPVPNAVYELKIYYTKRLPGISGDNDSNDWTRSAEELIRYRAKWDILMNVIRNNEEAQLMKVSEREAIIRLRSETGTKLASGRVRPWGY